MRLFYTVQRQAAVRRIRSGMPAMTAPEARGRHNCYKIPLALADMSRPVGIGPVHRLRLNGSGSLVLTSKMPLVRSAVLASLTCFLTPVGLTAPARAQDLSCAERVGIPQEKREKKRGLGGLLAAARKSGLGGSIAGALRGDGNLASRLEGTAQRARSPPRKRPPVRRTAMIRKASPSDVQPASTDRAAPETAPEGASRKWAAAETKYPRGAMIPAESRPSSPPMPSWVRSAAPAARADKRMRAGSS